MNTKNDHHVGSRGVSLFGKLRSIMPFILFGSLIIVGAKVFQSRSAKKTSSSDSAQNNGNSDAAIDAAGQESLFYSRIGDDDETDTKLEQKLAKPRDKSLPP